MDEQRIQEYWDLIQKLLACASGQEAEILQANHHLIDEDLVAFINIVADQMAENEELHHQAEWLKNLAEELKNLTGELINPNPWEQLNQQVVQLYQQGEFAAAIPIAEKALDLANSLHPEGHPDVATSLNNLTLLYDSQGRYEAAEPLYLQALEMRKRILGEDHPSMATSLNNLALLYDSQGRYEQAEPLYVQALEMNKRILGEDHPDVATSLNDLAGLYKSQGRYEQAEPLYVQALEMSKRILGEDHPDVASSLNNLAGLYKSQGRYEAAEPLYVQALEMRKRILGEDHPDVASSLNNLAGLYKSQGRYEAAEPLYVQALEMRKRILGEDHPSMASSLNNLAGLYKSQGRYEQAEPLYVQALEMNKRILGEDHPSMATSLNNLAGLYDSQGRYEQAEPLYVQALEMNKRILGEDHPSMATSLNNLAGLYDSQGRYEQAEPLYVQALEMRKRILGEDHPSMATSLNNLAGLYKSQGRYEQAEPLYVQALEMRKRILGENHPDVATSLNDLAQLYHFQGFLEQAEPLFKEALEMYKRILGEDHPYVATSLNNLAELYRDQGRYEQAEPLYVQALEMNKRILGEDHPSMATSLNNLAGLYDSQGRYEQAEPLYVQALEMRKRILGENHPHVATSLNNLALLYDFQGRYEQAEPLYVQALEMRKRILGENHPDVASSLNNLAGFLAATKRPQEALKYFQAATEVEDRIMDRIFAASSETDRLRYLDQIRTTLEVLLSLVWQDLRDCPAAVQTALDVVLKRKALSASAQAAFNYALLSDRYPRLQQQFQKWRQLNQQILHLTYSPPGMNPNPQLTSEQWKQQLDRKQTEADDLAKSLAAQVPEIKLQAQLQTANRCAIAQELPQGAVLLEFVRFRLFDFQESKKKQWQPARYVAFVLPAGEENAVQMVDLGTADEIDQLIDRFRQAAEDRTSDVWLGLIHQDQTDRAEETGMKPMKRSFAQQLSEILCPPLLDAVGDSRHWYIAPDGNFNLLPLQLLPLPDRESDRGLLIDQYNISYLSVGRDLLRDRVQPLRPAAAPLIFADPDFDLHDGCTDSTGQVGKRLPTQKNTEKNTQDLPKIANFAPLTPQIWGEKKLKSPRFGGFRGPVRKSYTETNTEKDLALSLLDTLAGTKFLPAPGTDYLGETVANQLKVRPFLQQDAREPYLATADCPSILLIATHGYFQKAQKSYFDLILRLLTARESEAEQILAEQSHLVNDNFLALLEILTQQFPSFSKIAQQWRDLAEKIKQNSPQPNGVPKAQQMGQMMMPMTPMENRFSAAEVENAMMRSGLALAGANLWLSGQDLPKEYGKGFLFAYDIANLDLWANELTVLSACETGIGDVKQGEGVFGMRRAFAVAGCKTLVMSLWKVPDKVTALLMSRFFENLRTGVSRYDALKDAQNYIRTLTIDDLPDNQLGEDIQAAYHQNFAKYSTPFTHPFYWGAWVLQGETTPINLAVFN